MHPTNNTIMKTDFIKLVLVISESMLKLQKLLGNCDLYAKDLFLIFNGNKFWCVMDGKYQNFIGLNKMSIAEVKYLLCWYRCFFRYEIKCWKMF